MTHASLPVHCFAKVEAQAISLTLGLLRVHVRMVFLHVCCAARGFV